MWANRSLAYFLFAVGGLFVLALLVVAYLFLGEVLAIKGSYLLFGIVLAGTLYGRRSESDTSLRETDSLGRWSIKLTVVLATGAYLATYLAGARLLPTAIALALGYSLIAYQVLFAGMRAAVIPQIAILFTVSPVTKYLSTGFYFGATDLLSHVRAIELLYRTGRLDAIGAAYSTYSDFPALHVLSGAISAFTGLPAYDSLVLLGILIYTTVVIAVFYLCRAVLSPAESIAVTLVFSLLSIVHEYTTYFFPQALATALLVFLLYAVVRRKSIPSAEDTPLSLATVLVTSGLVFAHHVTQIIFAGIVGVLYSPSVLRGTKVGRRLDVNGSLPRVVPVLFALTAGITYLFIASAGTVEYFVRFTTELAENPFVSDTGGARTVFGLGTDIPFHTPPVAARSLLSVDGIYYIGLAALFVAGTVVLVVRYERYATVAGFAVLGIGGSVAVLRTPLVSTVSRLSLPMTLFFAFVAGIGLRRITTGNSGSNGRGTIGNLTTRRVAAFALIVAVGTTGPLVAGDDLYGLHAGPNLWETYSTPEQQVEFSEQELHQFEATVRYVDQYTSEVAMLWVSREASGRFGPERDPAPSLRVTVDGIRADGPLVYRTQWTEHQVGYSTDRLGTVAIADWWLDREIGATNKVYTTGMVGVVRGGNETRLSATRGANRR